MSFVIFLIGAAGLGSVTSGSTEPRPAGKQRHQVCISLCGDSPGDLCPPNKHSWCPSRLYFLQLALLECQSARTKEVRDGRRPFSTQISDRWTHVIVREATRTSLRRGSLSNSRGAAFSRSSHRLCRVRVCVRASVPNLSGELEAELLGCDCRGVLASSTEGERDGLSHTLSCRKDNGWKKDISR